MVSKTRYSTTPRQKAHRRGNDTKRRKAKSFPTYKEYYY